MSLHRLFALVAATAAALGVASTYAPVVAQSTVTLLNVSTRPGSSIRT